MVDAGTAPKSYYPFSSADPRGQFLRELGYRRSERVDKLAGDGFGAEVAKERVDLLDVDRLFLLIDAPARKRLDGDALFNRLDVAREQRVTDLPYSTSNQLGAAVAFNSVLSIPYALDGIEDSLSAASPARKVASAPCGPWSMTDSRRRRASRRSPTRSRRPTASSCGSRRAACAARTGTAGWATTRTSAPSRTCPATSSPA